MLLLTFPTLSEFRHVLPVCLRCATDARFNVTEAWLTEAAAQSLGRIVLELER